MEEDLFTKEMKGVKPIKKEQKLNINKKQINKKKIKQTEQLKKKEYYWTLFIQAKHLLV